MHKFNIYTCVSRYATKSEVATAQFHVSLIRLVSTSAKRCLNQLNSVHAAPMCSHSVHGLPSLLHSSVTVTARSLRGKTNVP